MKAALPQSGKIKNGNPGRNCYHLLLHQPGVDEQVAYRMLAAYPNMMIGVHFR
jgi:hypothetical protein